MNLLNQENRPVIFKLTNRRESPALAGRHYAGFKRIPSEDTIFEKGKSVVIRYAQGEQTIYKEKQPLKIVLADIVFSNGYITIEKTNPLLIEYLEKSNYNASNPSRIASKQRLYEEVNASNIAAVELDRIEIENNAVQTVFAMDIDELKGYARVLGIDVTNTVKEIKHDMVQFAKKSPKVFLAGIDNPNIKVQELILDAQELGIVVIDKRSLYWNLGDGKRGLIVTAPIGTKIVEYASEWIIGDKEGELIHKELKKKVDALMD